MHYLALQTVYRLLEFPGTLGQGPAALSEQTARTFISELSSPCLFIICKHLPEKHHSGMLSSVQVIAKGNSGVTCDNSEKPVCAYS